jgi:hypothetical protein
MNCWTHDDMLVNCEAIVADTLEEFDVYALEDVPSSVMVPSHQLDMATIGDIVELKNGTCGVVFDTFFEGDAYVVKMLTTSLRIITKRA